MSNFENENSNQQIPHLPNRNVCPLNDVSSMSTPNVQVLNDITNVVGSPQTTPVTKRRGRPPLSTRSLSCYPTSPHQPTQFGGPSVSTTSTLNSTLHQATVSSLLPIGIPQVNDMSLPMNIIEPSHFNSPIGVVLMASFDVLRDITNVTVSPDTTSVRKGRGRPPKSAKPLPFIHSRRNQTTQFGALHIGVTTSPTG